MQQTFSDHTFHAICDKLASRDADLKYIIKEYGYPPMWNRPNTFETLVHIILEQQVSLASALAALNKLREKIKKITPARVLKLTDEELRGCYFSRQKTNYVRGLANALATGQLDLAGMKEISDNEVRTRLTALKGIGNWTVDVYLIFVLHRADIFPLGDLAAVNAVKKIKKLPKDASREKIILIIDRWAPHRTIAAMLLWHYYLSLLAIKARSKPTLRPSAPI
jgi:DNA-3-methyladenine glycosylase II